jgi:hypothetical protein
MHLGEEMAFGIQVGMVNLPRFTSSTKANMSLKSPHKGLELCPAVITDFKTLLKKVVSFDF